MDPNYVNKFEIRDALEFIEALASMTGDALTSAERTALTSVRDLLERICRETVHMHVDSVRSLRELLDAAKARD